MYIRETTGNRHICSKCKAKRHEKYMRKIEGYKGVTNFAQRMWECNDQYCGKAWENQHFVGQRSVQGGLP